MIKKIPPAQLWIGSDKLLVQEAINFLKKQFCGCNNCTKCNQIENKQHHGLMWLQPEKNYLIEQTRKVISKISLASNEKFFFVFQKADFLTNTTANSLLKSIEEPPENYYFIFLAQRKEQIIPTIRSRCIIKQFSSKNIFDEDETFINFFKNLNSKTPEFFLKELEKIKPNERESVEFLDEIFLHWLRKYKSSILKNDIENQPKILKIVNKLKQTMLYPPMPGSSKIFWKNLFLQLNK